MNRALKALVLALAAGFCLSASARMNLGLRLAMWNAAAVEDVPIEYAVSFDANGGSGTMAGQTFEVGRVYKLPKCTLTPPTGKTFKGWAGSNGRRYDDEMLVFDLGDVTLTAIWQ